MSNLNSGRIWLASAATREWRQAINGMSDHTHILFHLPPTIALAKAIQLLKTNSSK